MNDAVHARDTSSLKRAAALLTSSRFRSRSSADETPSLFALLSTKSGRNRKPSSPALEAMACGLPVILSYSAGMSDYLKNGVDALVLRDPQDANALVAALQRLLADRSLRATIGGECIANCLALLVGSPCRANSPSSPLQRRSPLVSLRIQHCLARRVQREFQ
jgi:glycosyltransferase involved in cell wall biosynthesis